METCQKPNEEIKTHLHRYTSRKDGFKMNIIPMSMIKQVKKKYPQRSCTIRISNEKSAILSEYQLVFVQLIHHQHHHCYRQEMENSPQQYFILYIQCTRKCMCVV